MVGLERISEFSVLPVEPPEYVEPRPPAGWPHEGKIDVENLVIRYDVCGRIIRSSKPHFSLIMISARASGRSPQSHLFSSSESKSELIE